MFVWTCWAHEGIAPTSRPSSRYNGTRLLRSAYFLTRDRGAAEDLVQSTLLATFTHWPKAQDSPAAYANRVLRI